MTVQLERETTEYIYLGIEGDLPTIAQEVAFMDAATRPLEADWEASILVDSDVHPLWAKAIASGAAGDYFLARLIGEYNLNDVILAPALYQVWFRVTGADERPVRIAPEALEIL